jgi:hypothetical protein
MWEWLKEVLMEQFEIEDPAAGYENPTETLASNTNEPPPAISLNLKDVYRANEENQIEAEIVHVALNTLNETGNFGGLKAFITPQVRGQQKPNKLELKVTQIQDTKYALTLPQGLALGLYRLKVKIALPDDIETDPIAMHDVFQVID